MMKYYQIGLVLMFVSLMSCGTDSNEIEALDRETVLKNIGEMVILPSHQNFQHECQKLHQATKIFQDNPSENQLIAVQNQWKSTQLAWKKCEVFEFGEAKSQFMHFKIGKWKTNAHFIDNNLKATEFLDESFVSNSGSTTKGLPAIEYLLFGEDVLESFSNDRKAQYLTAMTADLLTQSATLNQIWQDDIVNFQSKTQNGVDGSLNVLVNAQIALLEEIVNSKLAKPLGKDNGGTPNPKDAEAFLSGCSTQIIQANLKGIQASVFGHLSIIGLHELIELKNYRKGDILLSKSIENQFELCLSALQNINKPLAEMVISEPEKVAHLYIAVRDLLVLFKVDLASALSITVTFNDNDGD